MMTIWLIITVVNILFRGLPIETQFHTCKKSQGKFYWIPLLYSFLEWIFNSGLACPIMFSPYFSETRHDRHWNNQYAKNVIENVNRDERGLLPFSLPSYFPSHHRLWHYRYFPPGLQRWEENLGNYKVTKFCRSKGFSRSWFRSKRKRCCPIIKSVYVFVLHLSSSDIGYWTSSTDPRVIL